jgi:hypothetical protein
MRARRDNPIATIIMILVTVVFRTPIAFVMIALVIDMTTPAASTPETTRQS